MLSNSSHDFYCPQCKKKADTATPLFIRYSIESLSLVIFLCSPCRTIYIDKPTIRRIISQWRKNGTKTRKIPFKKLFDEFFRELEESLETYWIGRLGYKKIRFLKQATQTKP